MTDDVYEKVVDVLSDFIITCGHNAADLAEVNIALINIRDVIHWTAPNDVTKWSLWDVKHIMDTLAFNGMDSDKKDVRPRPRSYFDFLSKKAFNVCKTFVAGSVQVGDVSCVITNGSVYYYGLNVDADCSLGSCAERVALMSALSQGIKDIRFVLTLNFARKIMIPCGACLEFMKQMGLKDAWVAMPDGIWLPMRKVYAYVSVYRT